MTTSSYTKFFVYLAILNLIFTSCYVPEKFSTAKKEPSCLDENFSGNLPYIKDLPEPPQKKFEDEADHKNSSIWTLKNENQTVPKHLKSWFLLPEFSWHWLDLSH